MIAPQQPCAADAASPLDALQAAAQPRLQALLFAAAQEVCPGVACVLTTSKEAVRRTLTSNGADFGCHAPIAAWLRLRATAAPLAAAADGACGAFATPDGRGVRVVTRSSFGVLRSREYDSAAALAEAWLEAAGAELGTLCADARAAPGGALALTTRAALAAQRAEGRLLCAACGRFYAGRRGLRDHSQIAHGAAYEDSVSAVHAARRALVVVPSAAGRSEDPLADAALHDALTARAAAAAAARDALHPGLVAARDGDAAALLALLDSGCWDARTCADKHGSTAMHYAAGGGHLEACRLLVQRGGVDAAAAQKKDGRTALHWAARNGHMSVCAWLAQQGVDAGAATRDGTTAFHWAAWRGHLHVMAWLADEAGVDWRALNAYGCNAGQWAAMSGDLRVCEWLLARGLDWQLLNANGHSCLHKAAAKGQADVCAWLLRAPAPGLSWRHLQPDGDGNTPQRMAAAEGHEALAAALQRAADEAAADEAAAAGCMTQLAGA
jgi:ankyrin repeat protein